MALHLLLAISQIAGASARYCYSRNGTTLLNAAFQPCNNATTESACCMTNHSGAGDIGIADDKCLDNGLCQNYAAYDPQKNNEGEPVWGRQGCTDPLWQSPYCLADVCNKPEYADQWGNVGVHNCGGRKWCCGEKTCCNDVSNIFELAAVVGPTSTASSTTSISSSTATASATAVSSASTLPSSTPAIPVNTPPGGLSTGAKAGIGAGVAGLVIVVAAIALLLCRSRKSRRRKDGLLDENLSYTDKQQYQKPHVFVQPHELGSQAALGELSQRERSELASNYAPQELEARSGNRH